LDLLKSKMEALKVATAQYVALFTGQNPENVADKGDSKTQAQRIRGLDVGLQMAAGGLQTTAQGRSQLFEASEAARTLDERLKTLPGSTQFFADGLKESAPVVNETFTSFTSSALQLTTQMQSLNKELREAAGLLPQLRGNRGGLNSAVVVPPINGNFFGGLPRMRYYNFGGFTPHGSDRVPAMLGEDEYVMTGAASKAFAPILRAMNNYPSRAMGSGNSVTNVGDINITVQGGNSSAHTINEIGVGLKRAIARGTVKLHG
jgi:hypothetical protein